MHLTVTCLCEDRQSEIKYTFSLGCYIVENRGRWDYAVPEVIIVFQIALHFLDVSSEIDICLKRKSYQWITLSTWIMWI